MRRRSLVVLFAGVLTSALAACSVITGLNGDYTRQDDINSSDADATVNGEETSTSGPDATSPPDATADAGTFCEQYGDAANVAFCFDFEDSLGNPSGGFSGTDTMPSGQLAVEPDSGVDHSLGLRATITNPVKTSQAYVQRQIGNGAPGTSFDDYKDHLLEFDFVIYENSVDVVTIGSLGFESSTVRVLTGVGAYWDMDASTEIEVSSPPGGGGSQVLAPIGQWMHAKIHLSRPSTAAPFTTSSIVSKHDGTGAFEVTSNPAFDSGVGATALYFGAYFSSPTNMAAKISVGIDNILYTRSK